MVTQELINRCRQSDRAAQKALYEALSPRMMAVCRRYMGSREEAEDVLQEGFVTLFSKLDSYRGDGSFEGWARRVFVTTALMELRRTDALKLSDSIDADFDMTGELPGQIQEIGYKELVAMVASLPSGFRTVFNMFVMEGIPHSEIASALGISEVTSRTQLSRAKACLQKMIKERNERR